MEKRRSRLPESMERKQKLMSEPQMTTGRKLPPSPPQDVVVLDRKISEVESGLRTGRDGEEEDGSIRAEGDGCRWI